MKKTKVITGRPPMWDEIKRAKELVKNNKLSLQEAANLMTVEFDRPIYKKSVIRWLNYEGVKS